MKLCGAAKATAPPKRPPAWWCPARGAEVRWKTHLLVLSHKPGLKGGVQKRGGHPREYPPHKEDIEVVEVFCHAAAGVRQDIE